MDVKEKYKELYGKAPRKDWDEEKILERINAKSNGIQKEEKTKEVKIDQPEIEEVKIDESLSRGAGVSKEYKVIFNGTERWFTKNVINQALLSPATRDNIQIPEGSDFQAQATKCKSC